MISSKCFTRIKMAFQSFLLSTTAHMILLNRLIIVLKWTQNFRKWTWIKVLKAKSEVQNFLSLSVSYGHWYNTISKTLLFITSGNYFFVCTKLRGHPINCCLGPYLPRPLEACLAPQWQLVICKHGFSGCSWLSVFTHTIPFSTHYSVWG